MDTKKRTIIKTISYRFFVMLSLIVTGLMFAKDVTWISKFIIFSWTIGLVSFLVHERLWVYFRVLKDGAKDTKLRSILKTITWRLWSVGTMFLVTIFLMGATASEGAIYAVVSNIFFVVVHYTHERVWNKTNWQRT